MITSAHDSSVLAAMVTLLPLLSAVLLLASFVFMIAGIVRVRTTRALSLWMPTLGIVQAIAFLGYELSHQRWPSTVVFAMMLVCFASLWGVTVYFRRGAEHNTRAALWSIALAALVTGGLVAVNALELLSIAGFLSGGARVIPQLVRTLRTRDVAGVSMTYFALHGIAGVMGIGYESITPNGPAAGQLLFFCTVVVTNGLQAWHVVRLRSLVAQSSQVAA